MPADIEYDRHQTITTLLSGEAIPRRFAEAAATQLGQHELALLVKFFDIRDRPVITEKEDFVSILANKLEAFYAAETSLSNQDRTRLTIASGRSMLHFGTPNRLLSSFFMVKAWTMKHSLVTIGIGVLKIAANHNSLEQGVSCKTGAKTLLQGETFQISGARRDRMRIHLPFKLAVKIPAAADPLAVFLQCRLVQDGSQHTNYFATDALFGDPARRLGIQIRYQELETSLRETRTEWATAIGLVNAQKTDLLVGLLEHRSEIDTDDNLRPGSALEDDKQTVTSCPKPRHERKPNSSEGTGNENSVFKIGYKYLEGTANGSTPIQLKDLTRRGRHLGST
ncbi:hypothetical protein ONZ43_g5553 [Nemania bipapillata]|uniref:Uncharacterized protein n=1 Tax=Nemania bipapillata TaxID=110536 RepID=A0ACC2I9B1_9PEZI|nr:hypothetical protein ONZ43_g5553 [Nemania bipapillata]